MSMAVDTMRTVVLDRDLFEDKGGVRTLVARKGERVTPDFAIKHGVLPIESAGLPAMEAKVTEVTNRQDYQVSANKRLR